MNRSPNAPYTPPAIRADAFNRPFCHAYAHQEWCQPTRVIGQYSVGRDDNLWMCRCDRCKKWSIWFANKMVYPDASTAPPPSDDLPEAIQLDYQEARSIVGRSPRGAAALLRLCIQKLCAHLGETGKNINDDIGSLVKRGLPVQVQQALDIVRVVGNNAVHPGRIDLNDNSATADKLFGLVNLIAEIMITQPKHVESMYENVVPESQREAIKRRDDSP